MISLSRLLGAATATDDWLASPNAPHLWTLDLAGFSDPLDADAIWDDRTGDQPQVVESQSEQTCRRLRQALHDHRRRVKRRLGNGKFVEEGQVFTDLVLEIPAIAWNDALRVGAGSLEVMIHNLEQRHGEDFSNVLPTSRAPRYVVLPNEQLASGRVRCHFGYGVHVPGPEEVPELELSVLSADGNSGAGFAAWEWFRDGRREQRPVALYPQQDAQVLCPGWPLAPSPWFSDGAGFILLRRESMGGWTGFGDDRHTRFAHRQPATRQHGPRLRFESVRNVDDPGIVVELQAATEIAAQPGIGTLAPSPAALPGLRPYALWLEGFVLPALLDGLAGWSLWLDEHGNPLAGEQLPAAADDSARLSYDGRALSFTPPGGSEAQVLHEFPQYLRYGDAGIELDAPLLTDGLPLLRLPRELRLALDQHEMLLGRFDPACSVAAGSADGQADLLLDLLDQPGSLHWSGRDRQGALGAIGLSRRHLRLRLLGDQLELQPEGKAQVTLLDGQDAIIGALTSEGARLQVGQRLLAGCYLLRFDHDG